MGENTKIEWATHTFNPWVGCTKVSPACTNCYAERDMSRRKNGVIWGAGSPRQRTSDANWNKPLQWNNNASMDFSDWNDETNLGKDLGPFNRQRVFCASLSDVFDSEVDNAWREDLFKLIEKCGNLDWLLLTKRPENILKMLPKSYIDKPLNNIWLGTSVENQGYADDRIPELLKVPAVVHFISCEPLLASVDITKFCDGKLYHSLDWVIVGGESGPKARSMLPKWVRSLRDQSFANKIPFLFKQWGEWAPKSNESETYADMENIGKVTAGRLFERQAWDGYPASVG